MRISLDHINLSVKNYQKSVNFYKNIFGFELVESGKIDGKDWGILRVGDYMLCVYESDKERIEEALGMNHFALRVDVIEPLLEKFKKYKIEVAHGGEYKYPHSSSWYIKDPSGHGIEVVRWKGDVVRF